MHSPENFSGTQASDLQDILQKVAEHKGCGTTSNNGSHASCGSSAGAIAMKLAV